MPMPTRRLGPLAVSAIGLGAMNLNYAYGEPCTPEEGAALLNRAIDLGCTLVDTAALYGNGENERLIAAAIGHRRAEYRLTTKCVLDVIDGKRSLDGSPAQIVRTVEGSLARLKMDFVDMVYLHRLDRQVPVEESVGALVRLKEQGKLGAIGLSEMSAATIRRAHAVHPIAAVQSEYSPAVRNPEIGVLATCRELDIGFVAFSPVARGLLAASVQAADYVPGDIRAAMPRFVEPTLDANLALVARYDAIAAEAGCTPAQLALAWLLARGDDIVPIPGTRSIAHLEQNLAATSLAIDPALLEKVDEIMPPGALRGARYAAAMQAQIDTETFPDEELAVMTS
ncbi:aldo/keto reductase [Sphingomonas sp. RB1R13]|uniref:aldo/keto reductase n=1 Tax=Sphingomonas sp. RB1R13 TaxID=3096159 RepID=UPI002FC9399E